MAPTQDTETNEDPDMESNGDSGESTRRCLDRIDRKRLVSKLFYFFYFSSFGSLWPYLALYFKQLLISPRQLGIIVAVRSSLQFFFTPVWGLLADKFNKSKYFLLLGLLAWLVSTFSLTLVPIGEKPRICYRTNSIALYQNFSKEASRSLKPARRWVRNSSDVRQTTEESPRSRVDQLDPYFPWSLNFFQTPSEPEQSTKLTEVESFPDIKTSPAPEKLSDSSRLFVLILCIITCGMVFASPTQCLADTATLQLLGEDSHEYGKQALWGSVGYGLTAFIVGASVSGNKTFNPCSNELDINYIPCFYSFAVFMIMAIVVASRFQFHNSVHPEGKPSVLEGLKVLRDLEYGFFMFVAFFCGTAYGFIQTFLFWHLRELGGQQMLFSVITVTNSSAEVLVYLLSDRFISNVGHHKVIYLGLLCYALRFVYYSYCSRPWLFLPIELIQGITTAALWSAFVSYVGAEPGVASTLQGLVNGLYNGLGYATGGLLGGVMVHEFGTSTAFLIFGEISLIVLFCFIIVNNVSKTRLRGGQIKTLSKTDSFESVVTTKE